MAYLTPAVKNALNVANCSRQQIAAVLEISPQALSNKYNRDSFSGQDLTRIAAACGYRLAFVDGKNNIISLFPPPPEPAKKEKQEQKEGKED